MTNPVFSQVTFRSRNDDNNEASATWRQNAGVDDTYVVDTNYRCRFQIDETAARAWTSKVWNLYYSLAGTGTYVPIGAGSAIKASLSGNFVDNEDCTNLLGTVTGTFVTDNNGMKETQGATNSGTAGQFFEVEYCLQVNGTAVSNAQTYVLRIYDTTTAIGAYTDSPIITVSKPITATLTATLDAATLTSASALTIRGTATNILDAIVLTSHGDIIVGGALAGTLGAITLSAAATIGAAAANGALNATLGALTVSAEADLIVTGTLTKTLGVLALASANTLLISGAISTTLGALTLSSVSDLVIDADLTKTLDAIGLSAVGTGLTVSTGTLTETLEDIALLSTGTFPPISATLTKTLGVITSMLSSGLTVAGTSSQTLGALTLLSESDLVIAGALTQSFGAVTVSATGALLISGITSVSLGALGFASTVTVAELNIIEGTAEITIGTLIVIAIASIVLGSGKRKIYAHRGNAAYAGRNRIYEAKTR